MPHKNILATCELRSLRLLYLHVGVAFSARLGVVARFSCGCFALLPCLLDCLFGWLRKLAGSLLPGVRWLALPCLLGLLGCRFGCWPYLLSTASLPGLAVDDVSLLCLPTRIRVWLGRGTPARHCLALPLFARSVCFGCDLLCALPPA